MFGTLSRDVLLELSSLDIISKTICGSMDIVCIVCIGEWFEKEKVWEERF
ncbi:unnamed protein product [Meloidogyne enterolobii]|uniref:Uncharacterized protein n=1 Tax=Meloidogyne enterolobii TaxID=390850 RepID=A0ACB0ZKL2_MELEN